VNHEPGTIDKAVLMLITSIMNGCGLDDAAKIITVVQAVIHSVLCFISEADDVQETVDRLKSSLDPEKNDISLTLNRTTVSNMIPNPNISQLDDALEKQAASCLDDLDDAGLKHEQAILASDGTGIRSSTRHHNGDMQYIYIGQKNTFKRGFYFEVQYNVSDKLFVGLKHHDIRHRGSGDKMLEPWLQEIIDKCSASRESGTTPALVEGDRFYFKVGLFASATLGLLAPGLSPGSGPRVITPVKFTREKDRFKWNYVLDPGQPVVFTRYFTLKVSDNPLLATRWADAFGVPCKKEYKVPCACVALVDEYGRREKRTLSQLRAEAMSVQDSLEKIENEEAAMVQEYLNYTGLVHGKTKRPPAGARGKRREKFVDAKERQLYRACIDLANKKAALKRKKAELIKSLTFFGISLRPDEDPSCSSSTFLELAHEYHARWGIENGLSNVKWRFLYRSRARGPVRRTFYMVLAMMLYNRWQVERALCTALDFSRDGFGSWPSLGPDCWRPDGMVFGARVGLTAVTFLVECWRVAFLSVLKSVIFNVN